MPDFPKVSIIITNYNYRDYVRFCIESCLNQDYKGEIEVIVVDDCSTDFSDAVIHQFKDNIQIVKLQKNCGYSVAKNEGIKRSTGEFIATLDADDMMTYDGVSKRAQFLIDNPHYLLVYAQAYLIEGDGDINYWNKRIYKLAISRREDKIHAQTVMVRREVYRDFGLYEQRLRSRADNEMWWRLRNVAKIGQKFYFLKTPVAFYRKHDRSMVMYRKKHPEYNEEVTRILVESREMRLREGITRENTCFLKR